MTGSAGQASKRSDSARKITLLILMAVAMATVFLLPQYVSDPWIEGSSSTGPVPEQPSPSDVSPSRAAEKTRYRQESQEVLAEVMASRDRLRSRQVDTWAQSRFRQALQRVEDGDERYGYGEYSAALDQYRQAREILAELEQRGRDTLEAALAEGAEAVESLNVEAAAAASDLASRIAPEDENVRVLAARAETLPALRALMEEADRARAEGRLSAARTAYEKALELDPLHQVAAKALSATAKAMTEERFSQHMSRGFAALDHGEFDRAQQAFEEAGRIFPDRAAVQRALGQVDNERSQARVSRQIRAAAELEERERWQEALAVYEALLAEDPTLTEVKVRLIPTRARAELDQRLEELFDDPLRLAQPRVYRAAKEALADARGITGPGPRLQDQMARLEALLDRATSPVEVVFESDNQTYVTLFRVAELGRFERTTLELRPGRYVAAGTRRGYRDVRVEFTITGAPRDEPVVVRCVEPI